MSSYEQETPLEVLTNTRYLLHPHVAATLRAMELFPLASGDRCGIAPLMPRSPSTGKSRLHGGKTGLAACPRRAVNGMRTQICDPTPGKCAPRLPASTPARPLDGWSC